MKTKPTPPQNGIRGLLTGTPVAMSLLFCLLLANGCADLHTSKRSLHRRANRMFAGYGTWSRSFDSICLLGLEEVRKDGDVVALKSWEDDSPPVFAFHPPTNGRIVALYDMPHHLEPTHWPPPEILFVDSDWKTCALLYRGECLNAFLLTNGSLQPFTWTEFHPYREPLLFDKPIQPRTWTPVPFNSETPLSPLPRPSPRPRYTASWNKGTI